MKLEEDMIDGVAVLKPIGALASGPQVTPIQERIRELSGEGTNCVVLDMTEVQWCGSPMLGVMSSSLVLLKKAGGGMRLAGLSTKVTAILTATRLLPVFDPVDTVDEAVRSLQS